MSLRARVEQMVFRCRLACLLALGFWSAALMATAARLARCPDDAFALATCAHWLPTLSLQQSLVQVQVQPLDAAAWFNPGYLHDRLSQWLSAETASRRTTELQPAIDRAWYGLGLCLIVQARLYEALVPMQRAAELQPLNPHAWCHSALVHTQQGRCQQAMGIMDDLSGFEPRVAAQPSREIGLASSFA